MTDPMRLREYLAAALHEAGERAANAEKARAAAIAEIGELLRRAQANGDLVDVEEAEYATGLPSATLTEARDNPAAWLELTELAARARSVGDEQGDETALHARLPHLGGWLNATKHLDRMHGDAYWEARGGFDPWSSDAPGDAPGYTGLMKEYQGNLDAYAAGEPAYLRWLLRYGQAPADG
ncbi:hypothetical protein AB0F93_00535 [Micromonospora tulbaghiae]|uniref:hypothetical protein n=1 Tax=Micromonospora tulbaghiae TaxID=479978 RepID=UPI00333050BE